MAVDEWDHRQLCANEACIGVIGVDGTCKVCGHVAPNWGDERRRGLTPLPPDSPTEDEDEDEDEDDDEDDEDDDEDDADAADASDDDDDDEDEDEDDEDDDDEDDGADVADPDPDWDTRKLCADDACIGVVGPSGACNTCGKRPPTPG
ncbi:MAG: hypothetical protein NT062_00145 [Proteobacteria bacterium]|nr:hypothetical protein [Pseudomonadota bacterium]